MSYDNAPIGNTCTTINSIIAKMEEAKNEAVWCLRNIDEEHTGELNNIISEIYDAIDEIEQIRSDNSTLRDWGNELYYEKDELERENDDLLLKIENLESELDEERNKN
jgi:sugar-specific transcriptional regulator TrmB